MKTFLGAVLALLSVAATAATSSAAPAQRFPASRPELGVAERLHGRGDDGDVQRSGSLTHDDVDPTGREHLAVTITGNVATADGFAGRFTTTFGQNVSGPVIVGEFRGFLGLTNSTYTLQSGSGALVLLHGVSHVTIPAGPTGELTGEVDILRAECLGKPS